MLIAVFCFQYVTDESVHAISDNCPEIQALCISMCSHITDAALVSLGQGCHDLRYVTSQTNLFPPKNSLNMAQLQLGM